MKKNIYGAMTGLPLLLLAGAAEAHTGHGGASGLAAGFGHPLGGLDHMLAMIAVGVLGFRMGGRSVWALPAAFVTMMVVGGVLALGGIAVPMVEFGIAGSVVILGLVIAIGRRLPVSVAAMLVGAFAVFHGHAHGGEMPAGASIWGFGVGFVAATILLHGAGIAFAKSMEQAGSRVAAVATRLGGAGISAAGLLFAAG